MVKGLIGERKYNQKIKSRLYWERYKYNKTHKERLEHDQRLKDLEEQYEEMITLYKELRGELNENTKNLKLINQT